MKRTEEWTGKLQKETRTKKYKKTKRWTEKDKESNKGRGGELQVRQKS
jgi:hypothetical protein